MSDLEPSDTTLLDKKDLVGRRLQERNNERKKEVDKKKEEAEKLTSQTESLTFFMKTLTTGVATIKEGLSLASQQPKESLIAYFDALTSKLAEVQKFVTDSAMFLSSYDLAQKQQQLNELESEISSCRDTLLPKKKFAFKNKKKVTPPQENVKTSSSEDVSLSLKPSSSSRDMSANEYCVSNVSNQTLKIDADAIYEKDVIISSVDGCTIEVKGVPSAMHLTNLVDSTILCGPCTRSIFIERCSNCVLVVACQQLRIHEAVGCTFFIHVTSKAIIEYSRELKFAPYQLSYEGIDSHYKNSGLNQQINNWYDVDDFNWLVKDKQSPNWSILPEDKRIDHFMGSKE